LTHLHVNISINQYRGRSAELLTFL